MAKKIIIAKELGEIKCFFDENLYMIDREDLEKFCLGAHVMGEIHSWDLTKLEYGEIRLNFNPTRQKAEGVAERLGQYIENCKP